MEKFYNLKKYNVGDQVYTRGAIYRVASVYDDDVAEVLECDHDANRAVDHCNNCYSEYDRANNEWGDGFVDKISFVNEPEIVLKRISQPTNIMVKVS